MDRQRLQKLWILCVCLAMTTQGCAIRKDARNDVKTMSESANYALDQIKPNDDLVSPLTMENTPWFGSEAVPMQKGELLPATLDSDQALVITFDQPLSLEQVAARIQAATNVRVMVQPGQTFAPPGSSQAAGATSAMSQERFLPADGLEVTGGRMVWQGKLSNLLDQVADRFDAQWSYTGKAIEISQHVTRIYMLHSLAGTIGVGGSVRTSTGASDGSLPQQSVDTTTKLSMWEEIQKSIESIIGNKARASFSPATGTVTISGYPSAVQQAEDYLRMQNKLRLRRVSIETRVLSVALKKQFQNRLDLDLVFKGAFNGQGLRFTSAPDPTGSGQFIGGVLSNSGEAGSATISNAQLLNNIADDVTVEHTGSLVTLSDQPAPLQVATKQDYVKRVTAATTGTNGTSTSIEPGTLDLGLTMNVLPRVIEQDRVMLRVALGITDLVKLERFTSGDSTVQLPTVDTTGFLQNAVLQSGETLVLAGFERQSANENTSGTIWPWNMLLGGHQNYGHGREVRVLLIRAVVLPEEPMDVVKPSPSER